jgi:hypothetical protein
VAGDRFIRVERPVVVRLLLAESARRGRTRLCALRFSSRSRHASFRENELRGVAAVVGGPVAA